MMGTSTSLDCALFDTSPKRQRGTKTSYPRWRVGLVRNALLPNDGDGAQRGLAEVRQIDSAEQAAAGVRHQRRFESYAHERYHADAVADRRW